MRFASVLLKASIVGFSAGWIGAFLIIYAGPLGVPAGSLGCWCRRGPWGRRVPFGCGLLWLLPVLENPCSGPSCPDRMPFAVVAVGLAAAGFVLWIVGLS